MPVVAAAAAAAANNPDDRESLVKGDVGDPAQSASYSVSLLPYALVFKTGLKSVTTVASKHAGYKTSRCDQSTVCLWRAGCGWDIQQAKVSTGLRVLPQAVRSEAARCLCRDCDWVSMALSMLL